MPRAKVTFETAREIAMGLPGAEEGLTYGAAALKVNGKLMACIPTNKQAEPDSLMVRTSFDRRDELLEHAPDVYYAPPHYQPYPCVLIRLKRIDREALADLLAAAYRFVKTEPRVKSRGRAAKKRAGL